MALLVGTMWFVRYFHSGAFGLYEDDFTHLPRAAEMTTQEVLRFALESIGTYPWQGHPLHQVWIYLLGHVSWTLFDLRGVYLVGFTLVALNVGLFYALMRRVSGAPLGLTAGLAYVLYSADTTQAFLTHSLGLQPSITLLLLALHTYVSRRKWVPYVFISLAILTYETTFAVFLAAPLLIAPWDRAWRRIALRHSVAMVLILTGVIGLRVAMGEARVSSLGAADILRVPIVHMVEGPPVALATYLYRPTEVIMALDRELGIVAIVATVVFTGVLWLARPGLEQREQGQAGSAGSRVPEADQKLMTLGRLWARLRPESQSLLRLCGVGLVMLILAYPLTFTVRAYALSGRDTRVHSAGVVGASFVMGSLMLGALKIGEAHRRSVLITSVLGTWLGLLAAYGFVVQRDYVTGWELQKSFWSELVPLVPDVGERTVILVDPEGLRDTSQIGANYWNLPRVLRQLYVFPSAWAAVPRVYRLVPEWKDHILNEEGRLVLGPNTVFGPVFGTEAVDPSDAVLILSAGGRLERVPGPYGIGDTVVHFRSTTRVGEPDYPLGFLHKYLVLERGRVMDPPWSRPMDLDG